MSKVIHIHIHRAKTGDNWEEGKHKRAANGQFGSGGGGGAAPAAKSASSAAAKKPFEQHVKETRTKQLAAEARKSLGIKEPGAKPAAPAGPKSFEQHVKETRMKQLAAAGAKSLGITPKPAAKSAPAAKSSEALASEAYSAYVEASNQGDRAKADHFLRQHDKYAKAAKAEKAKRISAGAAPAKDAWEESKHKRASNGQFGSGGGGGAAAKPAAKSASAAKPAAKSASAAKPAIAVKYATSGSSALARLQAQSNAHLKKTGFGHLVTPPKNAPGTGTPKPAASPDHPEAVAAARHKEEAQKATSPVLKAAHEHLFEARSKNAGSSPSANVKSLGHISRTVHGLLMEHKRMAGNERVQKQLESQIAEALPKKPAAKSAPAVKTAPKSLEAQAREHEDTAAEHHVAAQAEFKKNGKTDEYVRLKNLAQKHTNLGTDLINQAVASSKGK